MFSPAAAGREEAVADSPRAGAPGEARAGGTGGSLPAPALPPRARRVGAYPGAVQIVAGIAENGLKLPDSRADRALHLRLRRDEPRRYVAPADRDAHGHIAQLRRTEPHDHVARTARNQTDKLARDLVGNCAGGGWIRGGGWRGGRRAGGGA